MKRFLRSVILWAIRDDLEKTIEVRINTNNSDLPAKLRDLSQRFG